MQGHWCPLIWDYSGRLWVLVLATLVIASEVRADFGSLGSDAEGRVVGIGDAGYIELDTGVKFRLWGVIPLAGYVTHVRERFIGTAVRCDLPKNWKLSNKMLFLWTFIGHSSATRNPLKIHGWEEWDLNEDLMVQSSRGWFDAEAFKQQVEA